MKGRMHDPHDKQLGEEEQDGGIQQRWQIKVGVDLWKYLNGGSEDSNSCQYALGFYVFICYLTY